MKTNIGAVARYSGRRLSLWTFLAGALSLSPIAVQADAGAVSTGPTAGTKIIGGTASAFGAWPWMTALVSASSSDAYNGQYCGGSLIHPEWVLTAAHCVDDMSASDIDLVIGAVDLETDPDYAIAERISARRIVMHPSYNSSTLVNDIALIQLSEASGFPAVMTYSGSDDLVGDTATAIGWGDTDASDTISNYPPELRQVSVPIVSNSTCTSAMGTTIGSGQVCAGLAAGGKDSCSGDSGGPLVVSIGGDYQVAGITSWGYGCAVPGEYGVYTRVSAYTSFIDSYVSSSTSSCGDYDGNGVVNTDDVDAKILALKAEFPVWLETCFYPQATCGDTNGDGDNTFFDAHMKKFILKREFFLWLKQCWEPEQ